MKKLVFAATALLVFASSITGFAQDGSSNASCSFLTIQLPGIPSAINDVSAIVGSFLDPDGVNGTAFLSFRGHVSRFKFPGSVSTIANDINNRAQIVGQFNRREDTNSKAFIVHSGGFKVVTVPGHANEPTVAFGINDFGDIVGTIGKTPTGFLLHNRKVTIISFPGAKGGTFPLSVNNEGVVVGIHFDLLGGGPAHGFMWKNGIFSNIQFPGAFETVPRKINREGDIVGNFSDNNAESHGFSLQNGVYRRIDNTGIFLTSLMGVNNGDEVVGIDTLTNSAFVANCTAVF